MKKFMIYWDESYEKEQVKLVGFGQFKSDFGFDNGDRLILNQLNVGETTQTDDGHIFITRVK